jgi:hypothetical protein
MIFGLILSGAFLLAAAGPTLLVPVPAYAGDRLEPVGTVTVAQGTARVFRRADGRAELIAVGTPIFQNDTIITRDDGMLRVRFIDKSMISVGINTTLTIDEYVHRPTRKVRRSRLRLLLGKVRCLVTDFGQYKEKRFMVNSQTAVTGVRGTDLIVWVLNPAETQVASLSGRTEVASAGAQGQSVQLEGRVWTRVIRGKAPAIPMALTAAILQRFLQGLLEGLPTGIRPDDFSQGTVLLIETNWCRDKAGVPRDPYFNLKGTWGQKYDDQWAIKRVGFTAGRDSAWHVEDGLKNPVTVAVIDTGLDWNHKDIAWENIWHNPGEIPDNGKDDDRNGYVDDVIGWNFTAHNNKPWDQDGHGTFVAGIIAAAADNGVGIAGINRGARIMVLKALNDFGHTRAANLAEAIFYAADNGAR